MLVQTQINLLGSVLGILDAPQQPQRRSKHAPLVLPDDLLESFGVAGFGAAEQFSHSLTRRFPPRIHHNQPETAVQNRFLAGHTVRLPCYVILPQGGFR